MSEPACQAARRARAADVAMEPVDPLHPDAVAALTHYFAELDRRFDSGFDPGDGGIGDVDGLRPPAGTFVLLRGAGQLAGCGGVQRVDAVTGEIKRMWVHHEWRGLGLGTRLLKRLELDASALGYRRVVLDTNGTLQEAIAMYRKAGYRETGRYNDNPYAQHWFTKDL